jgi:hypothetical protein
MFLPDTSLCVLNNLRMIRNKSAARVPLALFLHEGDITRSQEATTSKDRFVGSPA